MAQVIDTLAACEDCAFYIANDEVPDDRPKLPERIAEYCPLESEEYFVIGDDDGHAEFSWQHCGCCGSRLGGARYQVHILGA